MAHPGDSCNSGAECLLSTVCCATGGELTCPLIAQLFNSGPAALLEVLPEPGLPIVQASASFSAMIGCNAEILVRDRVLFADLVESQDRQRVLAPLEELGKEGAAGSQVANDAPYRLVYRGGDPLWVRDLGFTVSRSQSKVGCFICLLDVNARVQATSELANTSAAYSNLNNLMVAMADNLPEMLWAKDLEGRYTFANKAICDNLLHVESMSEVVGKTDHYFVDRERRERGDDPNWNSFGSLCESSDEAVKQSGQPQQFDEFGKVRGKPVCLDVHKKPIFNDNGELTGTVGSAHDVTEQKKMEGALKRWETIFETTQEGIMLTDADARILDVNPAFTRITGFSQEDVKGKRPSLLHSDRQDELFYRQMWRSIHNTGSWQGEIWNRHRDGGVYPEWLAISSVTDDSGKVINYVGLFADISEAKKTQERLDYLSHHDPLTGLYNRYMFTSRLEHSLQRARRSGQQLAVLFMDLDRFKTINETLGHPAGDALLVEVGARIRNCLREEDTVARVGGDVFAAVVEESSGFGALEAVASKLLAAVREPIEVSGHRFHCTASIGIARYPQDGEDEHTLTKHADIAMYRAKEGGRSSCSFYVDELEVTAFNRLTIEEGLQDAMALNQLQVYYQPQVSLDTGKPIALEALVRWNHPQEGLLMPQQFLPVAESCGKIVEIDSWVMHNACRQLQQWRQAGYPYERVAVNLSAAEFLDDRLIPTVISALEASGLPPECLELEITETVLMRRLHYTASVLAELKDMGCYVAIDDFGTGYSSLSYLKRLPVDRLKIDRSFVADLGSDESDKAITRAVIGLGHSLGLSVIAEGVETVEQEAFLKAEGCGTAQGYRYGVPASAEEMELRIAS